MSSADRFAGISTSPSGSANPARYVSSPPPPLRYDERPLSFDCDSRRMYSGTTNSDTRFSIAAILPPSDEAGTEVHSEGGANCSLPSSTFVWSATVTASSFSLTTSVFAAPS